MDVVLELFESLESNNQQDAEEAKKTFHDLFNSTKESWLVQGIVDYYISSSSTRSVDILVSVREPHDRFLFDRIADSLRTPLKLQALTLLGHIVRRHPTWLYKIVHHPLMRDLLRLLKVEKEVLPLMSALLIVIILLPIIAGLFAPHLQELFEVFSHLAAWNTNNPNKVPEGQLLHLQIGLYALFNRLYGMYPWNFLTYLRQQYSAKENLSVFSHTIKPMLDTVKVHPLLITASKDSEVAPARWKKMEANDVIMECAKFSIESGSEKWKDDCSFRARTASFRSRHNLDFSKSIFDTSKSGVDLGNKTVPIIGNFSINLPDGGEVWSPTVYATTSAIESTPTSITHTPAQNFLGSSNYSSQEGNSPPEAAIEATPESTPVKDLRQSVIRPSSTVARSLSSFSAQSQPSSPMKKESSPFRFPPSTTPTPAGVQEQPLPSAFQISSSKPKDNISPKVQRIISDREKCLQEKEMLANLKPKTPLSGNSSYQPISPLRVIYTPLSFERANDSSPHLAPCERSEEDREVESMMRADHNNISSALKRSDSVIHDTNDEEEYGECVEAGEVGGCNEGGLHMPDPRSIIQFARQVNRLRFHSQCQPDTFLLAQIGVSSGSSPRDGATFLDQKVRRAVSCPEMKKDTSFSGAMSELGATTTVEETDEDLEDLSLTNSLQNTTKCKQDEVERVTACTQTDEPQPLIYEPLFLSVFPPIEQIQQHSAPPDVIHQPPLRESTLYSPRTALETFIETTVRSLCERKKSGVDNNELKNLKQQLELVMLQLQFEKHRREVHAERNRRLLGKSRTNRALEEHNSALRDQVALMQKEIETLHNELERSKRDAKHSRDELQGTLNYWQEQTGTLQRKLKETQGQICLLEKQLEEEKKEIIFLNGVCTKSRAELFELRNTLAGATAAATAWKEMKGELATLQHHLVAAGELESRLRATISTLTLKCHKNAEALMATRSYSYNLAELQKSLKMSDSTAEAARAKINEVNLFIEEHKNQSQKQEQLHDSVVANYSEQLKQSEENCKKLRSMYNKQEEYILELYQKIEILEAKCSKLSKTKTSSQTCDVAQQSSPPLNNSLNSNSISETAETPQIQNLQLLVDRNEPGHS